MRIDNIILKGVANTQENEIQTNLEVENKEDFVFSIASSADEYTTVVTSFNSYDRIKDEVERRMLSALENYDPENQRYSAYLTDKTVDASGLTQDTFNELANNAQSDIKKILEINGYVRFFINTDDLIGKTYESIETNVNTDIRLSYDNRSVEGKKQKTNTLNKAKSTIELFNKQINLRGLIRSEIPLAFSEGSRVIYLRTVDDSYVVDVFPLGVAIVSDYIINGQPAILIDINELETRLKKTQLKNKKGKALFFEKVKDEIEKNYPKEVLDAYVAKEKYAILDHNRARVIRVNNLNRKYGLTPFFRALKYVLLLNDFADADKANSKAQAKKIIFQKLRKEVMGTNYDKRGWEDMSYAHEQFCKAFKQDTVLYTGTPAVEEISVIDTRASMTDIDTINEYRKRVMVTLGVNFLNTDSGQTVSTANLSITQLMLCINKIAEQLEVIFEDWYKLVLEEQSIGADYAPSIRIIDSELMETQLRIELAKMLYSTFNCSRETTFNMVGLDLADETAKRTRENEDKLSEVFTPYPTSYNSSGDDVGGRPSGENTNKQDYDTEYNKNR